MKTLLRLYDVVIFGLPAIAGVILLLAFATVVDDVVLRNLLISPPPWSVPLTEYGLLYITMMVAPWLVRTRGHILVEVVRQRLPERPARALEIVVYVICIAICAVLTGFATDLWIESYLSGEEDQRAIVIPRVYLYGPLVVGFFFMGCEFLRFLVGRDSLYARGARDEERV